MLDPGSAIYASGSLRDECVDLDAFFALLERPPWHAKAACHGRTGLFFPERGTKGVMPDEMYSAARALCAGCPAREPCTEAGMGEQHGMWAGMTRAERKAARRRRAA